METIRLKLAFACGMRSATVARRVSWRQAPSRTHQRVEVLAVDPLLQVGHLLRAVGLDDRQRTGRHLAVGDDRSTVELAAHGEVDLAIPNATPLSTEAQTAPPSVPKTLATEAGSLGVGRPAWLRFVVSCCAFASASSLDLL